MLTETQKIQRRIDDLTAKARAQVDLIRDDSSAAELKRIEELHDKTLSEISEAKAELEIARTDGMADHVRMANADAETPSLPNHPGGGDGDFNPVSRAIGEALFARMTGTEPKGQAREYASMSLLDIGAACIEANGQRADRTSRNRLADQILTRTGGVHTTSDFPGLTQAAGNRVLLQGYQQAQSALKQVSRQRSIVDFRALSLLKLGEAPQLLEVNEGGEFTHGTRGEMKNSFSLKTFGRIFSLSRQAIVSDDLGAFGDMAAAMGRASAELEASELISLLSGNGPTMDDTYALFDHTNHGNKAASGTTLDGTNMDAARQAMMFQTGQDGVTPINANPRYLVVGPKRQYLAEQLLTSTLYASETANTNPFSQSLTLLVEPRITDNSWYLFADPAVLPTLNYAYLSGAPGPQMFQRIGFESDGIDFKVRLDFGTGASDWRGAYSTRATNK